MCILTANDQVILGGNEPEELFKPEYFPIFILILHLVDLVFLQVAQSRLLCLLNGDLSCILGLQLLVMRLLLDLEVLLDVELCRYAQIDVDLDNWIKVRKINIIDLELLVLFLILHDSIEDQRHGLLFEVKLVDHVRKIIISFPLFLDLSRDLAPGDAAIRHDLKYINNGLHFIDVLRQQECLELGEHLLLLQTTDPLLLILLDPVHLLPNRALLALILADLFLLLRLRKVLIDALVK